MFSLETTPRFDDELLSVLDFIALDSPNRALNFYDELMIKLNNIPKNPFMYRKRKNLDNNTREVIFKGYTLCIFMKKKIRYLS